MSTTLPTSAFPLPTSTYVLFHSNCHDGFGAATAAWMKLGEDARYIPVSYGHPIPAIRDGSKVFILDFSYDRQTLLDLDARMERVVVLDHHATAQEALSGLELPGTESEIIFDMAKSGAVLAWEYFHDGPVPDLLRHIQDRDLWKWSLHYTAEVSAALSSYPFHLPTWAKWCEHPTLIEGLITEGITIRRLFEVQITSMAKRHRFMHFTGSEIIPWEPTLQPPPEGAWIAPMANATTNFSEVDQRLLVLHPGSQFAAYFSVRNDGRWQVGLRSRPDFDCSPIAQAYGGGGHKQACGFVL